MKYIVIISFLFIPINALLAQEDVEIIEITEETTPKDIPFAVVEKVPVYPGCAGKHNDALKTCFSNAVSSFVTENFNFSSTENYGDEIFKIFVRFIINKKGQVTDISVRAASKLLERKLIRVIERLPQMTPGKQKGKNVNVAYTFPIVIDIE